MSKALALILLLAMLAHVIKPFGLPGLKRRGDAWKIALVAMGIVVVTAGLSAA